MKKALLYVRTILAALVVAMGLAVGTSASGVAAASGSPITIGVICSCTGPLSSSVTIGPPAYTAWVSSINAAGGINGHKINLIVKDDASNPGTSLSQVQSLVTSSHAIALVDLSIVDAGWATYVQTNNVPVIGANSSSEP